MTQSSPKPKVSIGVPVFNGEKYLAAALDSALSQTFSDIEIIISNNDSSDRTAEIADKYVAMDDRVSVIHQTENVGAARNYNAVFGASVGEYFAWLACDDIMAADYVRQCVRVLDRRPEVAACYSSPLGIDADGEETGLDFSTELGPMRLDDSRVHIRYHDQVIGMPAATLFSVFRRSALEKTQLQRLHTGSDRTFVAEVTLYGHIGAVEPGLFFRRIHPDAYSEMHLDGPAARAYFSGSTGPKRKSALATRMRNHVSDIRRAELSPWATAVCLSAVLVRLPLLVAKHQIPPRIRRALKI